MRAAASVLAVGVVCLACGCGSLRTRAVAPAGRPPAVSAPFLLLSNAQYAVGIAPRLGGRVVLFQRTGGANVLLSRPADWTADESSIPPCAAQAAFQAYNGHIVWVDPQAEWWAHQDVDAERRLRRPDWPPDPWIEYGAFTVAERDARHVCLFGPPSPVTGLRLIKHVWLEPGGVLLRTVAVNTRNAPVRWGLWSNTRLPGAARCFVPAYPRTTVRTKRFAGPGHADLAVRRAAEWVTVDGLDPWPAGVDGASAKAHVSWPRAGWIAAFTGNDCFIKRFARTDPAQVHPDHAPIEIYRQLDRPPADGLLELEFHGPCRTLRPGESMAIEERWEIRPAPDRASPEAQAAFLRGL